MNPKNKTKIISAFPCLGKTFFAANNKDIALDLESSDFFFDKTGFEDYSSEQFKGLSNRVKKENGLQDDLKAIDEAVKSNNYSFVFISQTPDVVKGVIDLGYEVHLVKPEPGEESEKEFIRRAKLRGNNDQWINSTIKFLSEDPKSYYSDDELDKISVHFIPKDSFISDWLLLSKEIV